MPRTWLITGSSRGLGRELAEAVLAAGDQVVATARRPEQLQDLVDRYPDRARAVALDVTDRAQGDAAVRAAVDAFGRLDVVVNNAGYANVNSIEDFSEEDFRAQLETNLWGVINVSRAALAVLREQGAGHIIQISSVGGRVTTPGVGPYQTAKWAVEGFSGVLAKEVAPLGIHVTIVEPGGFRTDWAGSSMTVHDVRDAYRPTVGLGSEYRTSSTPLGDPRKGAQAILKLAQLPEPPLRLLLGSDAFALARAADEAKLAADDEWKELTFSTDHDDTLDLDDLRRRTLSTVGERAPGPVVFVATNRLRPGALEAERERVPELAAFLQEREPRLLAFNEYANAEGTAVTVVQVHPDTASIAAHLEIVRERAAEAYATTLDATVAIAVYGPADPAMLATLREQTGPETALTVATEHLGGFTRGGGQP